MLILIDTDEPPASPPAFLFRNRSVHTLENWTAKVRVPLEFRKAREMICIERKWMVQTKIQGIMTAISQTVKMESRLDTILNDQSVFHGTVRKLIKVAYNNPWKPSKVVDPVTGNPIASSLENAFNRLNWRKYLFHFGLRIMLVCSAPDEIMAKLSEIVDRVSRCDSDLKIGFNYLMVLTERTTVTHCIWSL
jgi:hypothetical protein